MSDGKRRTDQLLGPGFTDGLAELDTEMGNPAS
jgi:hypothetical protein